MSVRFVTHDVNRFKKIDDLILIKIMTVNDILLSQVPISTIY